MALTLTAPGSISTTQTCWYNSATSIFVILAPTPTPSPSSADITTVTTTVLVTASPSNSTSSGFNCTSCGSLNRTNDAHIASPVAAGIGIGSAVAGAIVAALIFFFFILPGRKSSSERYQQHDFASDKRGPARNDKFDVSTTVAAIKYLVPQPAEDDAMIQGLSTICTAIKDHVQNYYHTAQVDPHLVEETRFVELSSALAIPSRDIVGLLLDPRTRVPMLRLFLAHFILSRCVEQAHATQSFLPSEVLAFEGLNGKDQSSIDSMPASNCKRAYADNEDLDQINLFSKWKILSGTLLERRYSELPTENDPRETSIEEALAASEPFLRPFVIDPDTRNRNLKGIMRIAAQYAFQMFSQPCSYRFDFTRTSQPDTMVVFPALLVTVNHEGQRLSSPRVLRKKEVISLSRY